MSVKIYDGLRAAGSYSPFGLANRVRNALEPEFFRLLDAAVTAEPFDGARERLVAARRIKELHQTQERTLAGLDLGYDVILLPAPSGTLLLVFGEQKRAYIDALMGSGVAEEYGYWDNTDPKDGVASQEWDTRRYEWGIALADRHSHAHFQASPAENGLTVSYPDSVRITMHLLEQARSTDHPQEARHD